MMEHLVDPLFYELPGYETPFLVPGQFTKQVGETFERYDLRGKFTVIPMPSCLGRIDQTLKRVPPDHLEGFLKLVRERIAPRFDITPEFLTHMRAYDLKTGGYQHIYEDVWISRAPVEEVIEYFVLAFQILEERGADCHRHHLAMVFGHRRGEEVRPSLGRGPMEDLRKPTWYFLHITGWGNSLQCSVEYEAPGLRSAGSWVSGLTKTSLGSFSECSTLNRVGSPTTTELTGSGRRIVVAK